MSQEIEITPLLERAHAGDREALNSLARAVQNDLVRIAARALAHARALGHRSFTLDPGALVNETFVRLLQQRTRWNNRQHFFAIATRVMLRVLADYHRARRRAKRAGIEVQLSLGALDRQGVAEPALVDLPLATTALDELEKLDSRAGRVAKLRVLWGFDNAEVAEVLGVSRSTVDRDWRFARAWLRERV